MIILFYLLSSYLIGSIMAAWFIGKWYGVSLANLNSGNLGARNAGRTLGKLAFLYTFIGDAAKAAVTAMIGHILMLDEFVIACGVCLCILGHLFPVWLHFKGGKGVAALIGGVAVLNPMLLMILATSTAIALPLFKNLTRGMIFGFVACSLVILTFHIPVYTPLLLSFLLITYKHRKNLRERVS
ncbi:glycerol-3-phosphate acyltransferase [Rummeliibacillus stabekisii]|uniref:glycerol-3-phosphate acyltransferase n=1 Tax=Rummeliibacillus stabekisii TaxID=241244 RepID=UPI002559BAEC|nr:glycerol-3-phosphate acyltransferase [Rummeliibacillus stabekisii]